MITLESQKGKKIPIKKDPLQLVDKYKIEKLVFLVLCHVKRLSFFLPMIEASFGGYAVQMI